MNFALCDDNPQLLTKLKEILENIFIKHDFDATVSFATSNVDELSQFICINKIDVLFLDIDLNSKLNGIELAKRIREQNKNIYIIFVTGHFEYIVSAFECKTFDFIQKPFTYKRLEDTVIRLIDDANHDTSRFIKINKFNSLLNESLINFIQKDGMKAIYKTMAGIFEAYTSFSQLEKVLPSNFVRCHKSFIVNVNNISSIDAKTNTIFFNNSTDSTCFIGPKYKNKFMEVMNNYGNVK